MPDKAPKIGRQEQMRMSPAAGLMQTGEVLEVIYPDLTPVEELRDRLAQGVYPSKVRDYVSEILNVAALPLIRDKFSDEPLAHQERRAWRETLPPAKKEFVKENLLRAHRMGHALIYLEAIPVLASLKDDPVGVKKASIALMRSQIEKHRAAFNKESPDVPSPYEKMTFDEKKQLAFDVREFLLSNIETILNLYQEEKE